MSAELIMQEVGGIHNRNGSVTRSRLDKSANWKRQRIICVIPADAMIHSKVYLSHVSLIYPPNNGVVRILGQGLEVGHAYSSAIEGVLAHPDLKDWEYILTIEHDNLPPHDGILKLLESMDEHPEFSCISGLYFCKGENGCAQIWGDPSDPILNFRPQIPKPDQVQECCGVGMGFALWRLSMFKDPALHRPFFKTQTAQGVSTQDLYFFSNNRKFGVRCAVDTRVKTGHIDTATGIVW